MCMTFIFLYLFLSHLFYSQFKIGGLRSPHRRVRRRAPYLLLRLCKSLRDKLTPFVSLVFGMIQEFMPITAAPDEECFITFDDQVKFTFSSMF